MGMPFALLVGKKSIVTLHSTNNERGVVMHSPTKPSTRARLALATLLGTVVLAAPMLAPMTALAHAAAKGPGAHGEDVESRIKTLHSQLRITVEQEPAWSNVAQVMRDNAKAMAVQRKQEAEDERSASAPAMLNSYADTVDALGKGIRTFIPTFQTLYDTMSEAQKKTADAVFRNRVHAASARRKP